MLINKILNPFFFSLLLITTVELAPFLKKDETKLALDVISQLRVHHCIFYVHNEETTDSDIFQNFKTFSSRSLFTKIMKNETELKHDVLYSETSLSLIENDEMIIMKSGSISLLQDLLAEIYEFSMAEFKWLYFLEDPDLHVISDTDNPLKISYNCELIFVQRDKLLTKYVLREVYAINDRLFCNEIGKWDRFQGLVEFNDVPIRLRRKNLKRSELEVYTPVGCLYKNIINPRKCNVMEIVRDFSAIMNFTIVEIPFKDSNQYSFWNFLWNGSEILGGGYPFTGYTLPSFSESVGPVYKTTFNWYIKHPTAKLESGYYLKPFEKYFWMAVIFSILIGTIIMLITQYILKRATGQRYEGTLISNIFIGFETLCNQSGSEELENVSYRIISLSLRIIAIFSIAAYGAVITSFLANQSPQVPFSNLNEFLEIKEYKLVADITKLMGVGLEENVISKAKLFEDVTKNHWVKFDPENSTEVKSYLKRMCQEKLAFASFDNDIYKLNPQCDLHKIEEPLSKTWIYISLNFKSHFRNIFNEIFVRYYETGIQKRMQKKISEAPVEEIQDVFAVEWEHVKQILSIILIGVEMSLVFLVLELIYKNLKRKKTKFH